MASHNGNGNDPRNNGPVDWDGEFAKLDTANVVPFQRKPAEEAVTDGSAGTEVERYDRSYEFDLDDQDDADGSARRPLVGEVVDSADVPTGRDDREPIIPAALRPENIKATVRLAVQRALHVAGFHLVRAPIYAAKTVMWGVVGGFKLIKRQVGWWWLTEQHGLRQQVASSGDKDAARLWFSLHREAKATRRWRGILLAGQALGMTVGGMALWDMSPRWATFTLGAVALGVLAHYGRPAERPIVSTAVVSPRFRKLNLDVVARAYYAAGLGNPDKEHQRVQFGSRMARDGDGTHVIVDLPYGKGLDDAIKAKPAIASGLDVSLSQVFITRDATSHRRHKLWIADRDPLAVPAGPTPLLRCKPTDIWAPAPIGVDERGSKVDLDLLWASFLIGAQPRQGKTFFARMLALYCALDPYVKLSIFDPSAKPDWRKFALVADACAFGMVPTRDGDPIEVILHTLRAVKADVLDRYDRLSKLPVDVCPEGKLTRDIARDPKYRMPVHVIVFEEIQELFNLGEQSREIADLLVFLVKVAPAAGVILLSATQRPSGIGGTGPLSQAFINYRDNHTVRFSLRTGAWQVSDAVLGAGAYSEGYDSSTLLPSYKGVGILRGASDATPTVRSYFADGEDAEKILKAARALRERAGTLSGMAAGEDIVRTVRDVLADVRQVFGASETGVQWATIATRLAERMPEHYADASADAISAQLRALGVPSVDIKRDGTVLKGAKATAIDTAIQRRKVNGE